MNKLFILITSYTQIQRKIDGTFQRQPNKAYQMLALVASQKNFQYENFCMRNAAAKLTFIILTFNITFINKSHGDIKRRCII